jgi:hypothetical protein
MGMFDLGIGGLFKGFSSFMQPEKGYKKGQEQLDKYYNQSQGYYQPYVNQGQEAYGDLNNAMQSLLNPTELYDQWMNSYQTSDAAKFAQERAMDQGLNAASAMGVLGSTPAMKSIQAGTNQIGSEDQLNYIKQLMNMYLPGAELAQGIYGTGAQAGNAMGQNAMQMGQNSAQMAFGKQNAPGQMFNDLLKTGAYAYGNRNGNGGVNPWSSVGGK